MTAAVRALCKGLLQGAAVAAWFAAAPSAASAKVVRIIMDAVAFHPPEVSARVGDTVEWINRDIVDHTATARDGSFGIVVRHGHAGRITLGKVGSIDYRCRYHPNMDGRIVVGQ